MRQATIIVFAATIAVALAAGEYYVPRAYFTIDATGHETAPIPLTRLRRSLSYPYPQFGGSATANARADANAYSGGSASANAAANANSGFYPGYGSYAVPGAGYGASNPQYANTY